MILLDGSRPHGSDRAGPRSIILGTESGTPNLGCFPAAGILPQNALIPGYILELNLLGGKIPGNILPQNVTPKRWFEPKPQNPGPWRTQVTKKRRSRSTPPKRAGRPTWARRRPGVCGARVPSRPGSGSAKARQTPLQPPNSHNFPGNVAT